ncbi:MAG: sulfatase-like hydrolase/transferase [Phycisphaerales bacterium]|nr:sulfatase-like hydrolase/transferase [Phycisphaerales bacterium]
MPPALRHGVLLLVVLVLCGAARLSAGAPNIVLVIVDDLGWRDLGCQGSDYYETPNIDRLAASGMAFTQAYANAANCAPSRAALHSGQYPPRTGVYTVGSPDRGKTTERRLLTPRNETVLPADVVTIAERLRRAGYATGHFGKWHLGAGPTDGPLGQGFDVNVGGNAAGHPKSYRSPYGNADLPDGPDGEFLTTRLTDDAIRFMRERRAGPYFACMSYYAVHAPIQPEAERLAHFRAKTRGTMHTHPGYAAMIGTVDAAVGRLLDAIDASGRRDDTIVIFMSDHGGLGTVTTMDPLRGSKGMFYEGGLRIPLFVRWPGQVDAGSRCDDPVIGLDLYPTIAAMAGIVLPDDQPRDGIDLTPRLRKTGALPERSLCWHFPAYLEAPRAMGIGSWRTTPCGAIRRGDLKLIEFFEDGRRELYDLATDIGETTNLVSSRPDDAARLHAELVAWRRAIEAPVPTTPNPRFVAPVLAAATAATTTRPPNIVYILADDLGYGEVGCYGQTKIGTPNIDAIAAAGVRFTQHYAGNAVCAPSRCCLMTGLHPGHAHVRDNNGAPVVGQEPLPDAVVTVAERLKALGYTTGCMGKWGLGGPDTSGLPNLQGFDHWFGYLDQWNAHSHYPAYLWRNREKIMLDGNRDGARGQYSQDLITAEALDFIRERRDDEPFFLYVPYCIPHVSLHVPEDSLAEYKGRWEETPYPGAHYAGHETPRAAYAAMVSHMDRDIGRITALLAARGLDDDTIVIFTSDNGPTYAGGADSTFFESTAGLRGLKGSLFEGGIRVPFVAQWPGRIPPGTTSDHVSAFWDMTPTFVELAGGAAPTELDGISMLPALLGQDERQRRHGALYWELGRAQAVRAGPWKLVRQTNQAGDTTAMLFNLDDDRNEERNLADARPEILDLMLRLAREMRRPSDIFPSPYDDGR